MSPNEGALDRDIRLGLGIVLVLISLFVLHGIASIIAGVVAVVLLVTSAVGFCPLYRVFGINTIKVNQK